MKQKTIFIIGLSVIVVETLFFGLLVYGDKPEPSAAIGLILIVPILFALNIIVGLILYFRKSKALGAVLFVNSIVCPMIFYIIWTSWFEGFSERNYSQYLFSIGSEKYEILLSKGSDDFSITDITNQHNGTSTELYYGSYGVKSDSIMMMSTDYEMFIVNKRLYFFPKDSSAIELKILK